VKKFRRYKTGVPGGAGFSLKKKAFFLPVMGVACM
jgi:hypothetical protein